MKHRLTRPEQTGKRNLDFSGWIRNKLPDSREGFVVSDLDFVIANTESKKIMIVEQKNYLGRMRVWQASLFSDLDRWISAGIEQDDDWEYLGFHTVKFENTAPNNGRIWFDGIEITEKELINRLTF